MDFEEHTVALPSGPMRVQTRGRGPALIWTHGVFHPIDIDDHSSLGEVLRRVEGVRVVRYDSRGHGRTPHASHMASHRWDRLGGELLELASALGIDRFVAGGISMGAAVSLHAAVQAPARVAGLVLLAPPMGWSARPAALASYRELAALPDPAAVADQIDQDLTRDFAPNEVPPALRVMTAGLRASNPTALSHILHAAAESDLPAQGAVATIDCPALVLPWDGDPGHPLATAREIAATLRQSSLRQLASVADVDTMVNAIGSFLRARAAEIAQA